jgi:hypothetical protein
MRFSRNKQLSPLRQREEYLRVRRAAAPAVRELCPSATVVSVSLRFLTPTAPSYADQSFSLYPSARAYFEYPCPHGDCDGVLDITAQAARTLQQQKPHIAGTLECSGHRGQSRQPCALRVSYSISTEHMPRGRSASGA